MIVKSLWSEISIPESDKLTSDIKADALIIGGGLCGLLCAYKLALKGVSDIVLIDAESICSGITLNTTAKITSQHGLIYNKMVNGIGIEGASKYAAIHEQAIADYGAMVSSESIDCDFVRCSAYIYSTSSSDIDAIEQEALTMQVLNISADYVKNCELPLPISGAVRFNNQAKFHPIKFATRLVKMLKAKGVRIFTNTPATALDGNSVVTPCGKIIAREIVITTHFPFINLDSWFFVKQYQERAYVLALSGAPVYQGMYLDCSEKSLSFRSHNDLLLIGGYPHKTGHEADVEHYDRLGEFARELYPNAKAEYRWSAQDCMTHDGIPYIGRYDKEGHIYVATGFNKWGMTSSMAAASIISEQILSGSHSCEAIFDPKRIRPQMQGASFIKESADIAASFIKKAFRIPAKGLQDFENDEGGIVAYKGRRIGVYRDRLGDFHAVEASCTHMLCPLYWNKDDRTWDCPCHGSQFSPDGDVLGNPALNPLERVVIE